MPLNVRRFFSSIFFVFVGLVFAVTAQTVPPASTAAIMPPPVAPTSGDVMRERISKSKAYIAVRNYNAAIYELENIRKETSDQAVQGVVNVLLMNSYLEQSDYKRAQELLIEFYAAQKTTKPNASASYMAVAAQVIKGARSRVERYRSLGLSVSDRTLPLEATNDLEKMRETLEVVITHSKEIGGTKAKAPDAMMLLEEASSSRSMLARDDYDSRRWKDEVADTREQVVNSRSVVTSAVTGMPTDATVVNTAPTAAVTLPVAPPVIIPVVDAKINTPLNATREREVKSAETKPADFGVAQTEKIVIVPSASPTVKENPEPVPIAAIAPPVEAGSPMNVGSLVGFATSQARPVYPAAAKTTRTTGIVKVELTVSEKGDVSEVQKASGHPMLQAAARDAVRKWKFKPFLKDGQPVKATGFVNFNFAL